MKFWRFLLNLFHPIFIPAYYLLILFAQVNLFSYASIRIFLALFLFSMVLFPLLIALFFKKLGILSSVLNPKRQERNYLLLIMNVFYVLNGFLWIRQYSDHIFLFFLLVLMVSMLLIYLISLFYDLDVHTFSFGALFGYYLVLSVMVLSRYSVAILIGIILMSGLIGVAQLQITERKPRDIYIGFALGLVTVLALASYYLFL